MLFTIALFMTLLAVACHANALKLNWVATGIYVEYEVVYYSAHPNVPN